MSRILPVLRRRLHPLPIVIMTVLWVLLWGDVTWMLVIGGALTSIAILLLFPLPPLALGLRIRPWPLVVLTVRFLWDLVLASIDVAYRVVAPWVRPQGVVTRVRLRTDEPLFATMTAQMTILVPGTVVIDVDLATRWMIVHIFDAPDQAAVDRTRDNILAQEARVLRACSARADEYLARDPEVLLPGERKAQEAAERGAGGERREP